MWTFSNPARRQRGDVMLEALVGALVAGLLGAGFAHVASGILQTQHDAKIQNTAIENVRGQLQTQGIALCASTSTKVSMTADTSITATVQCSDATTSIALDVGGKSYAVTPPQRVAVTLSGASLGTRNNQSPLKVATGPQS